MGIGEDKAGFSELIDVGSFDIFASVVREVAVAKVIGEDNEDVGLFSRRSER